MNIIKLVSRNLFQRKGRFVFTLLGITIGMAAFVALLCLGGNMQTQVKKQASLLGANLVITPKNWCAFDQISILTGELLPESLQYDVYERVSEIEGLTLAAQLTQKSGINNVPVLVTGVHPQEMKDFKEWEIADGEYFLDGEDGKIQRAIVLGSDISEKFNLTTGDFIEIKKESFPVIGVLKSTGGNDDASVYMPIPVVQEIFNTGNYISFISARVDDITKMESYTAAIYDTANISVTSNDQLLNTVLGMLGSVNITLQLIAGVSLLAAAFGIINTMMTAITERRREIGIMRAVGAKSGTVFKIFILESGLYGLLGGVIGVIVGFAVSLFVEPIISNSGLNSLLHGSTPQANLSVFAAVSATAFSLVISIVSGLYPAWKASKLMPVEAISG
ncbi:MAG: ABC transporter permease [Oscillospiraceae bacterium]|nr:ABC transporter permease [Oscillospiraceae bacterium]